MPTNHQSLKPLVPLLAPDESLVVYICGKHKPVPEGYLIHAFATEYRRPSGQHASFSHHVSDRSADGENANSSRAILGALITTMRWLEVNKAEGNQVIIYSDEEYVTKYLPKSIEKWCKERKRANRDLLVHLLPYFKDGAWRNKEVRHVSAIDGDQLAERPTPIAQTAEPFEFKISNDVPLPSEYYLERLKETVTERLNEHIQSGCYADDECIEDFFRDAYVSPEDDQLRQRAMARDRDKPLMDTAQEKKTSGCKHP
jgi:ribonuclease HI